ncbi:MAG TPA: hypothetical protein VG457_04690 [Planctomycetota bacterium]|nr:hypothetical protein [Planctomycetota bacterium]
MAPARRRRMSDLPPILRDLEAEPIRQDWLLLTPGQRLLRAWRMRRSLKDPEALHDDRSLPRL